MVAIANSEREHEDHLFGKLVGKSRRIKPSEVDDEFLRAGFLPEVEEDGAVESFVVNEANKWTAQQVRLQIRILTTRLKGLSKS